MADQKHPELVRAIGRWTLTGLVLNSVIGVSKAGKPTLVWAADEIVYAPEIAVEKLHLDAIADYMDNL